MIYDVIVVGTGAGGSTVARELSIKGLDVLILEKGEFIPSGSAVTGIKTADLILNQDEVKIPEYEFLKYPGELMYIEGVGGTTPVSLANACYACTTCYSNSPTAQFKIHDLELFEELMEASRDLKVGPLPQTRTGPVTRKIWDAAEKLGYFVEPMPKFIDYSKCNNCGLCIAGCTRGAKWDATDFVNDAVQAGAKLVPDFTVKKVLQNEGKCYGVEGVDSQGDTKTYQAQKVILAAGALNTPKILINSQITAGVGEGLFTDLFITVGGFLKDAKLNQEIPMGIKSEFGAYFLSPHFSSQLIHLMVEKGFVAQNDDVVGLMVKIADEANGSLNDDGSITKTLTSWDLKLLTEGYDKAVEILTEIGVDPSSIVATPIRGAHPGGTAAMGKVVDRSLETEITDLFIADASVIPQAPGRPPILTITSLAKRLAKNIIQETVQLKN
ncbi:GMC family oxidoreductase N-terminal domain-containing protein [Methanobacterium sp. BAmetb5]|uniref:GMC family oxidoreductase N-terminal domain-containing protein n=1 Tax=Methanobacterium sp. BAmetb5 TaxID=2025351 RepID=UPI000E9D4F20|nr:GMC family oxidoreductase N-terminal domain-containing protein [Methanobacterium sp. BAmetb5]AXV39282.1 MAG: glucose-methanol-choline oxidoreductase [Methanobacterium sp. BAmetb5]